MTAGFTRADLESGRVTLEDAEVLVDRDEDVERAIEMAQFRLTEHARLERERCGAGLSTDFERWQRSGEALD